MLKRKMRKWVKKNRKKTKTNFEIYRKFQEKSKNKKNSPSFPTQMSKIQNAKNYNLLICAKTFFV